MEICNQRDLHNRNRVRISLIMTFALFHICAIILLIYHFEFAYQIEAQISKHGYKRA